MNATNPNRIEITFNNRTIVGLTVDSIEQYKTKEDIATLLKEIISIIESPSVEDLDLF